MKYLPTFGILAFHLLPIAKVYANPNSFGSVSDTTNSFRKVPPLKAVKPVNFERHKWDASVDASFVLPAFYQIYANGFYGNTPYGYGNGIYGAYGNTGVFTNTRSTHFMLRKNESVVNAAKPCKGAYRTQLYVGGGYSKVSKDSIRFNGNSGDTYFPQKYHSVSLGASVGYEWQQQTGRFQLFYGYDVFVGYNSFSQSGRIRNYLGRNDFTSDDYHSVNAGVAPLAGVKFFVSPQFSLSLESTFSVRYYRGRENFTGSIYGQYGRNYQDEGLSYGLTPISAFNATFHFGQVNP